MRILLRHQMLVGICACRHSLHRSKPAGRQQYSEPDTRRNRMLLHVEHPGNLRAERKSRERLVSNEPQKKVRVPAKIVRVNAVAPLCITVHSSEEKIHTEISNQDTEKRHDTVEQEEPRIAETLEG